MNENDSTERTSNSALSEEASDEPSPSYVVPEPDGIRSGHPLHEESNMEHEKLELTSKSFNERLRGNQNEAKKAKTSPSGTPRNTGRQTGSLGGLSIRAKLIGSLCALTVIILAMGLVSMYVLRKGNIEGHEIANNHTELAKLSGEITELVYQVRDAEKEFLFNEGGDSLNAMALHMQHLRERLPEIIAVEKRTDEATDRHVHNWTEAFEDILDHYELVFTQQAKDVKAARNTIGSMETELATFNDRLQGQIESTHQLLSTVTDDHWVQTKKRLGDGRESSGLKAALDLGVQLSELDHAFGNLHLQALEYLKTGKRSCAESVVNDANQALALLDRIHGQSNQERFGSRVAEVSKSLRLYGSVFRESMDQRADLTAKKQAVRAGIDEKKQELADVGNQMIESAHGLAGDVWEDISRESASLASIQANATWAVAVMMAIGSVLGITILIAVPRPILTSLSRLVVGAERVAVGDLSHAVSVSSSDELGQVAGAFEEMRSNLISLVDRIQRASVQISTTVNEINAAANQQSATATEQASALNQFSASLSEVATTAETLASASEGLSTNAMDVSNWVEESNNNASLMLESMNAINVSTNQTSDRIKALNDKMDGINDAVGTISNVADQTTLLSLNAAIEANKAGETGKGFSVVSTEIRRLSDRSIDAASGISGMVREIQRAAENSVVAMDKSSEEIRNGIESVRSSAEKISGINEAMLQIRDRIVDISNGTKDQATASQQAQQTVHELLSSSKMVAQAAQQTSSVAFELTAMSNQLAAAVSAFTIS